jgi:hypothetical protein
MAFEKLRALKCFPELDKRVRGGISIEDVASFIQDESAEYTEIKRDSLIRQLYRFKDSIPANQLAIPEAKHIHEKLQEFAGQVDEVDMLQKLFYVQMERVFQFREIEKATKFPIKAMYKEIEQAKEILVKLGELKIKLGHYEGAATHRIASNSAERRVEELSSDARERLGAVASKLLTALVEGTQHIAGTEDRLMLEADYEFVPEKSAEL